MSPGVAVVTGAGSGIGRSVARSLLDGGYRVVLVGRGAEPLEETARGASVASALVVPTDVTVESAVEELFARVRGSWGRVDLLFNNAGVAGAVSPVEDLSIDDWQAVIDTNLTGAFLCAREAFRTMKGQRPRGGRIINNGSVSAQVPRPYSIGYTASKHAVSGLTKSLSLEGRRHEIACGQIDIGNVASGMAQTMHQGVPQANGSVQVEPVIDIEHVARAVVYMASLPLDANVQTITVMATAMPLIGRG
jgi:NAD(P)-dependent dehydrogenase (short-subunit alcohol dehydrogenase family)